MLTMMVMLTVLGAMIVVNAVANIAAERQYRLRAKELVDRDGKYIDRDILDLVHDDVRKSIRHERVLRTSVVAPVSCLAIGWIVVANYYLL
jgi:hypothetical protein